MTDYEGMADRTLDELVAERVLGLKLTEEADYWQGHWPTDCCNAPSIVTKEFVGFDKKKRRAVVSERHGVEAVPPIATGGWDGAGRVLEAMRERGWGRSAIRQAAPQALETVYLTKQGARRGLGLPRSLSVEHSDPSIARAAAIVALKALDAEEAAGA